MFKHTRVISALFALSCCLLSSVSTPHQNLDINAQFLIAIVEGNHVKAQHLLKQGANIELRDDQGATPLIMASKIGNNTLVKLLLKYKANVNATDAAFKDTALKWAAYKGHLAVTQTLLEHKANIHMRDKAGYTALMDAARKGHRKIVECLLKYGAQVDDQNYMGETAFSLAKAQGHTAIMDVLRSHKADEELGEESNHNDVDALLSKLAALPIPKDTKKEIRRIIVQQEHNTSADKHTLQEYLNLVFSLPWNKTTPDNFDIAHVRRILDEEHFGLKEVKEKIIDYIATLHFKKDGKTPILCLVGPPGTGKTSIAKSIARALGKKYERIALGGIYDESLLRGHIRTYIAARPGIIIKTIKRAQTINPVIVLDEIDKMGRASYHGDPYAVMLEILDPEQNKEFRDNYLETPFDLSKVFFIATANDLDAIPWPLRDRMEIIELSSYSEDEKLAIVEQHLIKQAIKDAGLENQKITISTDVLKKMIKEYSHESGVRNIKRLLAKIMAKIARELIEKNKVLTLNTNNLEKYLGPSHYLKDSIDLESRIGVSNGLYWSPIGGGVTQIEAAFMPKTLYEPPLKLTGQLQTVAQESAETVLSYARAHAQEFGIADDIFTTKALHINWVSKTFTPADGPSAGVAMLVATLSALTNKPVKAQYAMTGAINLRGQVMAIGGLKEKILGAKRCGIKRVIVPHENKRDIEELEKSVTQDVDIIFVKHVDEVLKIIFV